VVAAESGHGWGGHTQSLQPLSPGRCSAMQCPASVNDLCKHDLPHPKVAAIIVPLAAAAHPPSPAGSGRSLARKAASSKGQTVLCR